MDIPWQPYPAYKPAQKGKYLVSNRVVCPHCTSYFVSLALYDSDDYRWYRYEPYQQSIKGPEITDTVSAIADLDIAVHVSAFITG